MEQNNEKRKTGTKFIVFGILAAPVMIIGSAIGANSAGAKYEFSLYQTLVWLAAGSIFVIIGLIINAVQKHKENNIDRAESQKEKNINT